MERVREGEKQLSDIFERQDVQRVSQSGRERGDIARAVSTR